MFRKMRRFKQELNETECKKILKNEVRGVLSVIGDDGYPYGLPIDYWYDEIENRIYFHGAKEGHKLDAIKNVTKYLLHIRQRIQKRRRMASLYKQCNCFRKNQHCK